LRRRAPALEAPEREAGASTTLKVVIASLIAVTSLLGAVGAWRASEASDGAASAERKGFAELVASRREKAQIRSRLDETIFDYVRANTYREQARLLGRQAAVASREDAARLRAEAQAVTELSRRVRGFVPPDALTADGALALNQKFAREYEVAKGRLGLDASPEFRESDKLSSKSEWLVLTTAVMIAAAFFFTLAQVSRRRARVLYLGVGMVVLVAAGLSLALLEVIV
jgi:hypothetical protein